ERTAHAHRHALPRVHEIHGQQSERGERLLLEPAGGRRLRARRWRGGGLLVARGHGERQPQQEDRDPTKRKRRPHPPPTSPPPRPPPPPPPAPPTSRSASFKLVFVSVLGLRWPITSAHGTPNLPAGNAFGR